MKSSADPGADQLAIAPRSRRLVARWERDRKRYERAALDLEAEFDAAFYARVYDDVNDSGLTPLQHYVLVGWRQRRDPSPTFSTSAYLDTYPDVIKLKVDPFRHYLTHGRDEGRVAVASLFAPGQNVSAIRVPAGARGWAALLANPRSLALELRRALRRRHNETVLRRIASRFDEAFYVRACPAVTRLRLEPIRHFILSGWRRGMDPSPLFSTDAYRERYGDVAKRRINPFYHFLVTGEGRVATPSSEAIAADIAGEFDAEFYAATNPELADGSLTPIEHYLLFGWRDGRDPSAGFSTSAYLESYPDVAALNVDPLYHYLKHGRTEGRQAVPSRLQPKPLSQSGVPQGKKLPPLLDPRELALELRWALRRKSYEKMRKHLRRRFDEHFYVTTYPEVTNLNFGPIRHFLVAGWREGKDPSPMFSTRGYLDMYGDVAETGINPFYHFVMNGEAEGRIAPMSKARQTLLVKPTTPLRLPRLPTQDEWLAMPQRVVDPPERRAVNVVIPVYKSLPHVAATIASVLSARCGTNFECLVVDDASPEPEVSALLAQLAASGHIRLIVNEENCGFVVSVNRAMKSNTARDVVLLNADTEVHDGWLDRLLVPFAIDQTIATITPLSNNATIASYPNTAVDNPFELEVGAAELDRIAAVANGHTVVDVPTGIGFCMAIRRRALDVLRDFDAETFGTGYGEECDFCMRALKGGWRNVIAPGVYVRHWGSTSFGASESTRSAAAQVLLARRHPDYKGRIGRYLSADPLLPARIRFDVARLREALGPVSVLFVSHTRGGGIETFLDYERSALLVAGKGDIVRRAVVMRTLAGGFIEFSSFAGEALPYLPNLQVLNLERHKALIAEVIRLLDPELVHVNTFAGLTQSAIRALMAALSEAGRPYWHVWHDHQPLCPRLTFLDAEERYCGETDASRCTPCLAASSTSFEWVRIDDWRDDFRRYLAGAAHVSAPSEAAALRARRLVGVSAVKVEPHPEPQLTGVAPLSRPAGGDDERRIVTLGALGPHKGAYLLSAMAKDAAVRDLGLKLHVVGYTAVRDMETEPKAVVHGRYFGDADAARRVTAVDPHFFLCASVWPETYIFTLSVAMALGLPVVCFDIGAQAERVRAYGRGIVLPLELANDPGQLNDALLTIDVDALWELPANVEFPAQSALSRHFAPQREAPVGSAMAAAG